MKKMGRYVGMLVFVLIGAACGAMIGRYMATLGGGFLSLALLIALMYAVLLVQIAAHEAGHLVFGLLSGYRFSSYRLFSFMWVRQNGKIRFRRFSLAGTGGQCLMEPPELVDGAMPVALYNLGGPLANLLSALICLLFYPLASGDSCAGLLLRLMALIGAAFALMNGIPMRMGAMDNDGYNALSLRRDKSALRAFWVQMKVNAASTEGTRLKDMPAEWFVLPADEAMSNPILATVAVLACNRLMDQQRFSEAEELIRKLLGIPGVVGIYKGLLRCDRIYLSLLGVGESGVLPDKEQRKFMKSMKSFPSVIRTEYALALLGEQDSAAADKALQRFEKCAKSYPSQADIESERELMAVAAEIGKTAAE